MTTVDLAVADAPDVVSRIADTYRYVPADWAGPRYRVQPRPGLRIRLEHGDGYTAVVEVETGIHGVGPDVHDAWGELRSALAEHIDVLRRQDALAPGLAHQLEYLTERLDA
jgi:predicted RNase H-like HicB family nuclease